jgi:hypothetical protein
MTPGTVFQLNGDGNHIRIVISPHKGNPPFVLVCNLSDRNKHPDSPCFFDVTDHDWITKPSAIPVRKLDALPVAGFEPAIKFGQIRVSLNPISPTKLQEICSNLLASTAVSEKWKWYLR